MSWRCEDCGEKNDPCKCQRDQDELARIPTLEAEITELKGIVSRTYFRSSLQYQAKQERKLTLACDILSMVVVDGWTKDKLREAAVKALEQIAPDRLAGQEAPKEKE